jgi:hypothetical protein
MKVKFREVKRRCRQIVENYRKVRKDDREFPVFLIRGLAEDGTRGEVHLYRKAKGKTEYVSKGSINFESIPELAVILESLGKAWDATRPSR